MPVRDAAEWQRTSVALLLCLVGAYDEDDFAGTVDRVLSWPVCGVALRAVVTEAVIACWRSPGTTARARVALPVLEGFAIRQGHDLGEVGDRVLLAAIVLAIGCELEPLKAVGHVG